MKILIITLLILGQVDHLSGQSYLHPQKSDPGFIRESENFIFYSHFWLNMHHFLYNKALVLDESGVEIAFSSEKWNSFDKNDQASILASLRFFNESITKEDLRTGDYNYSFKRWIVQYPQEEPLPISENFKEHVRQLNNFKSTYEKYFWKNHHAANKRVLNMNIELIQKYESRFIKNLTKLCKAKWQNEKIRVDISHNSKRDIPYTTTKPTTHIIMDSKKSIVTEGGWFELLLHESSHHLISSSSGFIGGTILNVTEVLKQKAPRQLWHAYLFYISGKVAQDLLIEEGISDYEIYMVRNKVFNSIFQYLDEHLAFYMSNELDLAEVTKRIIEEFNDAR